MVIIAYILVLAVCSLRKKIEFVTPKIDVKHVVNKIFFIPLRTMSARESVRVI